MSEKSTERFKRQQVAKKLKLGPGRLANDEQMIEYLKRIGFAREPFEERLLKRLMAKPRRRSKPKNG